MPPPDPTLELREVKFEHETNRRIRTTEAVADLLNFIGYRQSSNTFAISATATRVKRYDA